MLERFTRGGNRAALGDRHICLDQLENGEFVGITFGTHRPMSDRAVTAGGAGEPKVHKGYVNLRGRVRKDYSHAFALVSFGYRDLATN